MMLAKNNIQSRNECQISCSLAEEEGESGAAPNSIASEIGGIVRAKRAQSTGRRT
jgi:hypothetical protein